MFVARSIRIALVTAVALVLSAPAAEAAPKKKKAEQVVPTGQEDAAPPSFQEEVAAEALEVMTSRSSEGLTVVEHDDGMLSVDLEGRFMNVLVAAPRADGTKGTSCLTGHEALEQAQAGKTTQAVGAAKTAAPTQGTATRAVELEVK